VTALFRNLSRVGRIIFITGTDTGVGKTVFAALLARSWRDRGLAVAALKPVCSGNRTDARKLRSAAGSGLTLDEINPWHFRAPLSPLLAARRENRVLKRAAVIRYIRQMHERFPWLIVEGAGGLLSPLGTDFDTRALIIDLAAVPVVVCPNRLGAVNQARLTVEALPPGMRPQCRIALVSPQRNDASTRTNPDLLRELLPQNPVHVIPWLPSPDRPDLSRSNRAILKVLEGFSAVQLH
jgi:dethiobiotin synthetase